MKISIIGTGRVGSAIAFTAVLKRLADELVLVGRTKESGEGDAADSQQMVVRAGGLQDVRESDVIVLTASVKPKEADRLALTTGNAELFRELVPKLAEACPGAVYLVVTNPVDVMTHLTIELGKLPPGRVIGTGTLIDTGRYRTLLAEQVGIATNDIRAYILGEHGNSQFAALSAASAGGEKFDPGSPRNRELADMARTEGDRVFRAKGYTNFAIAAATGMLLEAIVRNTREVFPVSTLVKDYHGVSDVCLSVPAVVGRQGIVRTLKVELSPAEVEQLKSSAEVLKGAIAKARG
jgi:L-lactate dehydrogenase